MTTDLPARLSCPGPKVVAEVVHAGSRAQSDRACRWKVLSDNYLIGSDRQPDRLLLTYEGRPLLRSELSQLIPIEEQASPFLTWIMVDGDEGVTVMIQGNKQLLDELEALVTCGHDASGGV